MNNTMTVANEAGSGSGGAPSLKSSVFKASTWILGGHASSLMIRFFGTVILSRIFAPEVFGVLAIVSTIQIITHLFTDIGVAQAIIQSHHGQNREFLNTAWTVQIVRGAIIWFLGIAVALALVLIEWFGWLPANSAYAYPGLPLIIGVSCFSAVIMGFQTTKVLLASRNLDVKRITLLEVLCQILTLVFTIIAGLLTRSIWSYVAAGLLSSLLSVMLNHWLLSGPANRLGWNGPALSELSRFGRWVFVSSALGGLATNSDRMILAGFIAPAALGFYSIASNLVGVADAVSGRVFGMVALPALSSVSRNQPDRFAHQLARVRWAVDGSLVALSGFLFATGQWIVTLLYDARYAEAGTMLQMLSISLFFTRYNLLHTSYVALGHPEYLLPLNCLKVVSLFTLIPALFLMLGQNGAILAIALHTVPSVLLTLYLNRRHRLNNLKLEISVLLFWPLGWILGNGGVMAWEFGKSALLGR